MEKKLDIKYVSLGAGGAGGACAVFYSCHKLGKVTKNLENSKRFGFFF